MRQFYIKIRQFCIKMRITGNFLKSFNIDYINI